MKPIAIIWLIFTLLFIYLGNYHYSQSKLSHPKFEITERPLKKTSNVIIQMIDVDKPLQDFATDFNNYLTIQNISNKKQNIAYAIGYLGAVLTALVSFFLSFDCISNRINQKYNLNCSSYFKYLWRKIRNIHCKPETVNKNKP